MNRIYRIVWNAAINRWVVASEVAKGRKKSGSGGAAAAAVASVVAIGFGGPVMIDQAHAAAISFPGFPAFPAPPALPGVPVLPGVPAPVVPAVPVVGSGDGAVVCNMVGGDCNPTTSTGGKPTSIVCNMVQGNCGSGGGNGGTPTTPTTPTDPWADASHKYFRTTSTGTAANPTGTNATAIGEESTSGGNATLAAGYGANAGAGAYGVALGAHTVAAGDGAMALGAYSKAESARATALGDGALASHEGAVALGARLRPEGIRALDERVVSALTDAQRLQGIRLSGYADRLGADAYNLSLSQRRAEAVKAHLVAKGVPSESVAAMGRGEADPVVDCQQRSRPALIACLAPNRRVRVEITVDK